MQAELGTIEERQELDNKLGYCYFLSERQLWISLSNTGNDITQMIFSCACFHMQEVAATTLSVASHVLNS